MTESQLPPGPVVAASSLIDVLLADEDIDDVGALPVDQLPEWLNRLPVLSGWQRVDVSDQPAVPLARMAVHGPRIDQGWAAADTISVFGYTGWPVFNDVLRNASGTLCSLGAVDIATNVLPVPAERWVAALRSNGIARIGDRRVWIQQSNYVAGSEEAHAGRLIVHSIYVDEAYLRELTETVTLSSHAVYQGFVTAIRSRPRAI